MNEDVFIIIGQRRVCENGVFIILWMFNYIKLIKLKLYVRFSINNNRFIDNKNQVAKWRRVSLKSNEGLQQNPAGNGRLRRAAHKTKNCRMRIAYYCF